MSQVTICGVTVEPGQRGRALLPVTTLACGLDLQIPVHIVNGRRMVPSFC